MRTRIIIKAEWGTYFAGVSDSKVIILPKINCFPACSKLTVILSPMTDWTCPSPHSGQSGWRTKFPGVGDGFMFSGVSTIALNLFLSLFVCANCIMNAATLNVII